MTTTPAIIRWVDEVPPSSSPLFLAGQRQRFVALLQNHPGHWAQYLPGKGHSNGAASSFQKDFPGTEATARQINGSNPRRFDVYVRWVGP